MSDFGLEDVSIRIIGDGSALRTGVRVSEDSPNLNNHCPLLCGNRACAFLLRFGHVEII